MNKEEEGKLEISVSILGNEIIGFKMMVDDFKMKWLLLGIVAPWCYIIYNDSIRSATNGDF